MRAVPHYHSVTTLGTFIKRKDPRVDTERSEREVRLGVLQGLEVQS
jgi:hypothetical protein